MAEAELARRRNLRRRFDCFAAAQGAPLPFWNSAERVISPNPPQRAAYFKKYVGPARSLLHGLEAGTVAPRTNRQPLKSQVVSLRQDLKRLHPLTLLAHIAGSDATQRSERPSASVAAPFYPTIPDCRWDRDW